MQRKLGMLLAVILAVSSVSVYTQKTALAEEGTQTGGSDGWYVPSPKTDITRGNTERETPDENGMVHSYLTGKLVSEDIAYSRPVAIMINNIVNALPQSGLSSADVVYEAPVEGAITRLLAIFEDYADLDKIGPVRSCRDYYIDYAMEYDAIYVHYGQAVYAYDLLNSDMVDNISGLQYQDSVGELNGYAGEGIFYRTSDRVAPHNVYISSEGIQEAIEKKDYSMELDDDYTGHFCFAEDGETVVYSEGTAERIELDNDLSNSPYFEYDQESGTYKRFQYGEAQIDDLTGEQLAYENVIVQYSKIVAYDANGYLNINTNSGGEAVVYTKGTYQTVTWEKESDWGPVRYYDADGNEITLNQGKTWICIVEG